MFEQQLRVGRSAPEYGGTTESVVVASLPGGEADPAITRIVLEQDQAEQSLRLPELQVFNALAKQREMTTGEAARLTQLSEEAVRRFLRHLIERGLIEAHGPVQNRLYRLSASVYRQLGDSAGYVRLRGFDSYQHEQMVLQLIRSLGSVRNSDVAELCKLNPRQAHRLLARLVQEGKLERRGEKRGTHYVLVGAA